MLKATPTQNTVKSTAARRPRMRATIMAKRKMVIVKARKRNKGTPVKAMFMPRKV